MNKVLKQDILISPSVEGKSIEELNEEAQKYLLSGILEEIKVESNSEKPSGFKMFKVNGGGFATFCFHLK